MVKKKINAADLRVPQNRNEAADMIREIGEHEREVARLETEMNAALARVKADAEGRMKPLQVKAELLVEGLHVYCSANRAALTNDGATKTVDFGTGTVSWRYSPPKVRISGDEEDVIARIKAKGDPFANFIRAKESVDREAMLKHPDLARTIEGVSVGRAGGETFAVEPFAQETASPLVPATPAATRLPEVTP